MLYRVFTYFFQEETTLSKRSKEELTKLTTLIAVASSIMIGSDTHFFKATQFSTTVEC